MTRQRKVILKALEGVKTHPTADEVYEMVRRKLPRISLGTVYRNLEALSEQRLIRKLELGGEQKRFDPNTGPHYHIRCLSCGRVDDIHSEPIPGLDDGVRALSDFEITGHRLDFFGLCPECKEKGS